MTIEIQDIPTPKNDGNLLNATEVAFGAPISDLDRLRIMNSNSWEDFTLELVFYWKTQYQKVLRCGGAGDKGIDVMAYNNKDDWENYQCKYYNKALSIDDCVQEIGKFIYYSSIDTYTMPSKYYFVASQELSPSAMLCMKNPKKFKNELIQRWDKQCRTKITTTANIELDGALLDFINNTVDFDVFDHIPLINLIKLHSNTPYHTKTFGGNYKKRPIPETPPQNIEENELIYTQELLAAFSDVDGQAINFDNIQGFEAYRELYKDARLNFYSAESLERFSRDVISSPTSYDDLLNECFTGVSSVLYTEHKDAFCRFLQTSTQAVQLNYDSHPLNNWIRIQDKKGLCHQLINKRKFKWVL